jgi:hypothetical protein
MKRFALWVLMTALTISAAMSLMMPSAKAETIVFTAQMLAANEVAPVAVSPTEQGTQGQAIVTMDTVMSGSTITSAVSRFDVTLSGMAGNTVIILAHIHEGAAGVNGPIRVDSGLSPAAPVPTAGGAASFSRSNLATTPAVATAIIANPAGWYFNVHTALSPGGVARGQLVRLQQVGGLAAPTLSQWGIIIMTLLFLAAGTLFLFGRAQMAEGPGGSTVTLGGSARAINWKLFAKVALYVEVATALTLVIVRAGIVDQMGALAAALVVAFIIHLFIAATRRT